MLSGTVRMEDRALRERLWPKNELSLIMPSTAGFYLLTYLLLGLIDYNRSIICVDYSIHKIIETFSPNNGSWAILMTYMMVRCPAETSDRPRSFPLTTEHFGPRRAPHLIVNWQAATRICLHSPQDGHRLLTSQLPV